MRRGAALLLPRGDDRFTVRVRAQVRTPSSAPIGNPYCAYKGPVEIPIGFSFQGRAGVLRRVRAQAVRVLLTAADHPTQPLAAYGACLPHSDAGEKLRIVTLGFGTRRQKRGP
jgi:hypothetical protein